MEFAARTRMYTFGRQKLIKAFSRIAMMAIGIVTLSHKFGFKAVALVLFLIWEAQPSQATPVTNIIPDILSPKTTRAFWRQNNFNINKPAPLGAKLLGAFHLKCSTPFYS